MAIKQTAGHDALGAFAPEFAHLNDDVLFGEVWSREDKLPLKLRSIVTISALIGKGITDSSLKYHLASARNNGVTQEEMAEILTHIAFYAGWPNAWAAFNMAKEVYGDDETGSEAGNHGGFFGLGEPNEAFAPHFIGQSYLNALTGPDDYLPMFNATFEPGCRNNWHVHHASKGGGQVLICVDGEDGIRKRANPPSACTLATWWRSPRTLSTGTVPLPIAGSATWPSNTPAKIQATNGLSL
ncbi:carboxymuconolactone decarboxylase family protein [uncultured Senegalimassilia sp.]|uniref:carboxymuconolactone decarboxylase family protein n=1 Tax=uncultured Senegalimassilia sp. TaxID=1714350 RepID=UPI0027DDECF1|nr:carboxymuconolactone decarboxylase family protein [uncultured Senegalimassilia sp.]